MFLDLYQIYKQKTEKMEIKNLETFENYTGGIKNEGDHKIQEAKKVCEDLMAKCCEAMYEASCMEGERCVETYESMCESLNEMMEGYGSKCHEYLKEMMEQ